MPKYIKAPNTKQLCWSATSCLVREGLSFLRAVKQLHDRRGAVKPWQELLAKGVFSSDKPHITYAQAYYRLIPCQLSWYEWKTGKQASRYPDLHLLRKRKKKKKTDTKINTERYNTWHLVFSSADTLGFNQTASCLFMYNLYPVSMTSYSSNPHKNLPSPCI